MRPLPLIIILLVLDHIAFNGSRIAVSLNAIYLKSSALTVGSLVALYALLPALLSVTAGRWIDRVGVNLPMLWGSIGVGVGVVLPFILPGLPALYLTSFITGVSFMLINVAAYHAVGVLSAPEERAVNFSYVALGFSTSSFIGPLLSGIAIDQLGYRATFFILASFTILPIVALAANLVPLVRGHAPPVGLKRGPVLDLLRERDMRNLFVAMAILTVSWDVYGFAIPIHGTRIGLSASEIGIVMGAFAVATFAVRLAMPFIVQRFRPWTMLAMSLATAGLSFALLPFTESVFVMMGLMFLLGLGLGAPQPMILTILHESSPAGRGGEALGLRTTLINTSQTVMPLVFGAVGTAIGVAPLFWMVSLALFGGAAFAQRLRRADQRPAGS
jgi:predicted MFS family arabinose efflux permease